MRKPLNISEATKRRFADKSKCYNEIWKIRHEEGHQCFNPRCDHGMVDKDYRIHSYKPAIYCPKCMKRFSLYKGSLFENMKMDISIAFKIIFKMLEYQNGVNAISISRDFLIAPDTALYFMHAVREAMGQHLEQVFENTVLEIDVVHLKAGNFGMPEKFKVAGGGSLTIPVLGIVERNGRCIMIPLFYEDAVHIKELCYKYIGPNCTIYTDTDKVFNFIMRDENWKNKYESVNHKMGEYIRESASTNNVESSFDRVNNIIKTATHVSVEYLPNYCNEAAFKHTYSHTYDLGFWELIKDMSLLSTIYNRNAA